MTVYNYSQLEELWIQAGGSSALAPIMAAIAMAESSGNSDATNNNSNGTEDEGLWQINTVWGSLQTFDPLGNAQSAVKVYNSQGLSAWSTYNSGAYRQFLSGTAAATGPLPAGTNTGSSGSGTAASGPSADTTSWQSFLSPIWNWLSGGNGSSFLGFLDPNMWAKVIETAFFSLFKDVGAYFFKIIIRPVFWIWETSMGLFLMFLGLGVLGFMAASRMMDTGPMRVLTLGAGPALAGGLLKGMV